MLSNGSQPEKLAFVVALRNVPVEIQSINPMLVVSCHWGRTSFSAASVNYVLDKLVKVLLNLEALRIKKLPQFVLLCLVHYIHQKVDCILIIAFVAAWPKTAHRKNLSALNNIFTRIKFL